MIINPAVVEGQIAGGLAQAIGAVLHEEAAYDDRGNLTRGVPTRTSMLPAIIGCSRLRILACVYAVAVGGRLSRRGRGRTIIGPPTLVNAIADALATFGEVPLDLPLTPAKLLSVIEGRPLATPAQVSPAAAPSVTTAPPVESRISSG